MVTQAVTSGAPRLRADATRNRERIVAAAQEAFIEFGPDVPLDEIARRAGIGNATLYRHFPDRRELARGVVLAVLATMAAKAKVIMDGAPDAFTALEGFIHGAVEWKVGALCPMLAEWMDMDDPEIATALGQLDIVVEEVVHSARAEGSLRSDVGPGDIMIITSQVARPLPGAAPEDHGYFVHRHLQILLDGLRNPQRSTLPGAPATLQDIRDRCAAPQTKNR
jgi:AcrR family transcriptional regulator